MTKSDEADIRDVRKAKVLALHSQGFGEREIADKLLVSKTTVHDDIAEMRMEALAGIEEYVQNFPYEWQKAKTAMDGLIQRAY
jgi:transposase